MYTSNNVRVIDIADNVNDTTNVCCVFNSKKYKFNVSFGLKPHVVASVHVKYNINCNIVCGNDSHNTSIKTRNVHLFHLDVF